jgi:hypothetical protein
MGIVVETNSICKSDPRLAFLARASARLTLVEACVAAEPDNRDPSARSFRAVAGALIDKSIKGLPDLHKDRET